LKFRLTVLLLGMMLVAACTAPANPPQDGKLRILTEAYPPYNFIDKNKNVTGQNVELVQLIIQKLGISASIEVMPLSDAFALAQKGLNIIVFSINRTPQRESLYKWVGPIGDYRQVFYAKKSTLLNIKKLDDARQAYRIGVYKGDAGNQFLASNGFTNLDESQTDAEALKKLANNTVQLWLGNKGGLLITAKEAGIEISDLVEFPVVVTQADLYIVFSKDIPDSAVAAWQNELDVLKKVKGSDGNTTYDRIITKYADMDYVQSLLK
jgi:polar amino acid transport system substrate-binding protein